MLNGFVNVLKPVAATASDVVVKLRHILGERQIGHLGTLDPGATGVLPVAIGQGTKLFNLLTDKRKIYRAFFTFGKTTDTLDAYGKLTKTGRSISPDDVLAALKGFVGDIWQTPPQYSAIQVAGQRAYDLARKGVEMTLKQRAVTVYSFTLVRQIAADTYMFDIECSAGTYIRALARDLAESMGTVGYMSGLIRLQSGCFAIEDAYTFDELEQQREKCVLDIMYPLADLPTVEIERQYYTKFNNGVKVPTRPFDGYGKIYCNDVFFGVGKCKNGKIELEYYLRNASN
jgi:tRNA pseudouridine55 synthase